MSLSSADSLHIIEIITVILKVCIALELWRVISQSKIGRRCLECRDKSDLLGEKTENGKAIDS